LRQFDDRILGFYITNQNNIVVDSLKTDFTKESNLMGLADRTMVNVSFNDNNNNGKWNATIKWINEETIYWKLSPEQALLKLPRYIPEKAILIKVK
jgi:hypothetical protein